MSYHGPGTWASLSQTTCANVVRVHEDFIVTEQKKVLSRASDILVEMARSWVTAKMKTSFRCQLITWLPWLVRSQQSITFLHSRFQVAHHKAIRSEVGGSRDNLTPNLWKANSQMTQPCGINNTGNPLFLDVFGSHKVKARLVTVKYRLRPNCHHHPHPRLSLLSTGMVDLGNDTSPPCHLLFCSHLLVYPWYRD